MNSQMRLKQLQPTTSKPMHLLLQELGYKCIEDVYYQDNIKTWCVGDGVWVIERIKQNA